MFLNTCYLHAFVRLTAFPFRPKINWVKEETQLARATVLKVVILKQMLVHSEFRPEVKSSFFAPSPGLTQMITISLPLERSICCYQLCINIYNDKYIIQIILPLLTIFKITTVHTDKLCLQSRIYHINCYQSSNLLWIYTCPHFQIVDYSFFYITWPEIARNIRYHAQRMCF